MGPRGPRGWEDSDFFAMVVVVVPWIFSVVMASYGEFKFYGEL